LLTVAPPVSATAVAGAAGGGGAGAAASSTPEDKKITEILAYVTNLEAQMNNVAKHTGLLVKAGSDMATGLFDFGLAFTMLGQHETDALNGALSQMGHTADQLSLIAADQVEKEKRWFEEPIVDYIAMLGAVRDAIDRRQAVRKASLAASADLEAKKAALVKLRANPDKNAAKIPSAEAAVGAAETAETAAKVTLETVTARTLDEVDRFKRAKADDMRKVVLDYVQLQIEYNKQMEQQWAALVPDIEAIQVEKVAKRSIFEPPSGGDGGGRSEGRGASPADAALAEATSPEDSSPPLPSAAPAVATPTPPLAPAAPAMLTEGAPPAAETAGGMGSTAAADGDDGGAAFGEEADEAAV